MGHRVRHVQRFTYLEKQVWNTFSTSIIVLEVKYQFCTPQRSLLTVFPGQLEKLGILQPQPQPLAHCNSPVSIDLTRDDDDLLITTQSTTSQQRVVIDLVDGEVDHSRQSQEREPRQFKRELEDVEDEDDSHYEERLARLQSELNRVRALRDRRAKRERSQTTLPETIT